MYILCLLGMMLTFLLHQKNKNVHPWCISMLPVSFLTPWERKGEHFPLRAVSSFQNFSRVFLSFSLHWYSPANFAQRFCHSFLTFDIFIQPFHYCWPAALNFNIIFPFFWPALFLTFAFTLATGSVACPYHQHYHSLTTSKSFSDNMMISFSFFKSIR